jgi:hypothetical protein
LVFLEKPRDDIEIDIAEESYEALIDYHNFDLSYHSFAVMICEEEFCRESITIFVYFLVWGDIEISFFI